jgi:hypothetical protein
VLKHNYYFMGYYQLADSPNYDANGREGCFVVDYWLSIIFSTRFG